MDLVEDDPGVAFERGFFLNDFVAEDLGRHDERRGFRVDGDIAGQDADLVGIFFGEIAEFLVGERFDGGGVNHSFPALEALLNDVFGDGCFSRARGGADNHRVSPVDMGDGFFLEGVV